MSLSTLRFSRCRTLEELLRAARRLGSVCIVTSAARGWVAKSSKSYLLGLDLESLLRELDVQVHYAADFHTGSSHAGDLCTQLKQRAMEHCLRSLESLPGSLISVGDSLAEHAAARAASTSFGIHCKTVKFQPTPDVEELTAELIGLQRWLQQAVEAKGSFDLQFDDADNFDAFASQAMSA